MANQAPGQENAAWVVAQSLVASFNGPMFDLTYFLNYSVEALWSAGAAGTFKLQAMNGLTWTDIPGTPQVAAGAGSYMWNMGGQYYRFVRLVFTATGGSVGTVSANIFCKGEA